MFNFIKGKKQCEELKKKFETQFNENFFEIVFCSPLQRTIQTFNEIKSIFNENIPLISTDLIKERYHTPSDVGRIISKIKEEYSNFNFEYIHDKYWWRLEDKNLDIIENTEKICLEDDKILKKRVLIFLIWILLRKEKNICFVGHQNIYKCLFENDNIFAKKIKNADYRVLDKNFIEKFFKKYL